LGNKLKYSYYLYEHFELEEKYLQLRRYWSFDISTKYFAIWFYGQVPNSSPPKFSNRLVKFSWAEQYFNPEYSIVFEEIPLDQCSYVYNTAIHTLDSH
jgi:hypothetical protein